ncbi:MAG: hypothetical protein WA160_16670 [Pseudobdellovibrio sp.]
MGNISTKIVSYASLTMGLFMAINSEALPLKCTEMFGNSQQISYQKVSTEKLLTYNQSIRDSVLTSPNVGIWDQYWVRPQTKFNSSRNPIWRIYETEGTNLPKDINGIFFFPFGKDISMSDSKQQSAQFRQEFLDEMKSGFKSGTYGAQRFLALSGRIYHEFYGKSLYGSNFFSDSGGKPGLLTMDKLKMDYYYELHQAIAAAALDGVNSFNPNSFDFRTIQNEGLKVLRMSVEDGLTIYQAPSWTKPDQSQQYVTRIGLRYLEISLQRLKVQLANNELQANEIEAIKKYSANNNGAYGFGKHLRTELANYFLDVEALLTNLKN